MNQASAPKHTEVAVIGSGPSGYTAGIYAARADLAPVIFAGIESGGQLMYTTDVENFPGFPDGVNGPELMLDMRKQANRFGADIQDVNVYAVETESRPFQIWTDLPEGVDPDILKKGSMDEIAKLSARIKSELNPSHTADSLIISTGGVSRRLDIPGEDEFFGKGVSTCAVCDAAFYRDKTAAVVGGGDSAMEDALALAKFAEQVYVIHRREEFRASKIMQQRVLNNEKIEVLWNTEVRAVVGDEEGRKVSHLEIETEEDGEMKPRDLDVDGMFLAIGHKPMTSIFVGEVDLDARRFVITRRSFTQEGLGAATNALNSHGLVEFPSMTSKPGVFAAGDVVDVRYWQAVTAAAQGCQAAIDAERWLETQAAVE